MNLLLFLTVIMVSFIIVRIGAIAFQLTGLEWALAKFQALSCFTGTGFTTKESELIASNIQRRRIATALIVVGNAGLVTMIATFANTLRGSTVMPNFSIPFIHLDKQSTLLPWINVVLILALVYGMYVLFTSTRLSGIFFNFLRNKVLKKMLVKPVSFEELTIATGGYGISQIEIHESSPLIGKTLLEARLREHDISVLAVEKEGQTIPNPSPESQFNLGDKIICFGKLENIREKLCYRREYGGV